MARARKEADGVLNVAPGTLFIGDNLDVLRGIDTGTVDLVYLDPPFHTGDKKRGSNVTALVDGKKRKQGYGDAFDPSDLKREWVETIRLSAPAVFSVCEAAKAAVGQAQWAYLIFMAARLLELHRVLKETGSIWLHCDWHADGWLRALMDAVFGAGNLRNTVAWCYSGGGVPAGAFARKHDTLLFYSKGSSWTFHRQHAPYSAASQAMGKGYIGQVLDLDQGKAMDDWWVDCKPIAGIRKTTKEATGWEDQKPRALLDRIILACSNRGDVVLDPFCGCATALVSAQVHHRGWIGIDQDPVAEGVLISGYWTPKGEKRVGRLISEAGLLDVAKAKVLKAPPVREDSGETACDLLEGEFKLRQEQSMILTKQQQARLRQQLYARLEGRCQGYRLASGRHVGCKHGAGFLPIEFFELDHVLPRKHGGKDTADNLQLCCGPCNGDKGARLK